MKKLIAASALAAIALTFTAPAFAKAKPRIQFVDMSELLFEGERYTPQVSLFEGEDRPKFERLLKLKKTMLPTLLESAKLPVFK